MTILNLKYIITAFSHHRGLEFQCLTTSPVSTLIDIKVSFDSMSDGYESWWRVGTPEVSETPEVIEAYQDQNNEIGKLKQF